MNRLKELRKKDSLTLMELSEKIGIPNNTLSNYENEKREPSKATWKKLAEFFNVSVPYIMGYNTPPPGRVGEGRIAGAFQELHENSLKRENGEIILLQILMELNNMNKFEEPLNDDEKEQSYHYGIGGKISHFGALHYFINKLANAPLKK